MKRLAILILLCVVPTGAVVHRVSLTWNASTCIGTTLPCIISGYHVYRAKGSGPFTLANPALLTTLYWTDKKVYAGQVLHYCVTAVNVDGVESPCSAHVTARIP
jgi:fibronectin type 3 domain-containing protein